MTGFDLQNNFIIREYREDDYDRIVQFWDLTEMGTPERGDNLCKKFGFKHLGEYKVFIIRDISKL